MPQNFLSELLVLSVVIFAVVAWLKQVGVAGQALTISAFSLGLVIGLAYRYAVMPMVTFADWFWAIFFGLLAGAMATGAYKGGESLAAKAAQQ